MFSLSGKKSVIRKSILLFILSLLVVFVLYSILHVSIISAQQYFNLTSFTPTSINRSQITLMNFSVHANNTAYNITQVIVTLPEGATFYSDSNGTNASNSVSCNFSNTSNQLIWANTTLGGFVNQGEIAYFWFNVSVPTAGNQIFTIATSFNGTGTSNTTTQTVLVNFTFCGYVKNETGGLQNGTNVSIYRYAIQTGGPPIETYEASVLTNASGYFSFGSINGSASNYKLKLVYYGPNGNATKIGATIPPFPAHMFYPKSPEDQMNLNGTTFYLQPAATLRLNATNSTGGSITFGYEVIDQKVGFPIESNVKTNVSTVDVIVPSGRDYTVMILRDPSQFPFVDPTACDGSWFNSTHCPAPPKSNSSVGADTADAGDVIPVTMNLTITQQRLYGCINVSAGANNSAVNVTTIILRMIPWSTSAGLFIPPIQGEIGGTDLSDATQLNHSDPKCSGQLAWYNISIMGGDVDYLVEFYAKNGTAADDTSNPGSAYNLAAFQNVTIGSANKELNVTLYRLLGSYQTTDVTGTSNANTSFVKINIQNETGGAMTTDMHVEVRVKNSATGVGKTNYVIESLSNGTFYLPVLNNSDWARVSVFPNEAPPLEKELNLSKAENNVTLVSVSFAGGGDKGVRHMLANGSLACTNVSSMPILLRFLRRGTTEVITEMNASGFNPMKAMVAGSIDLEIKVTATNVTMKFNNFDMFSAKQPPMFAIMDNASLAASSQTWKFGNFVPRDVYDNVTLIIPYDDTVVNESWAYTMSIPVLYKEDPNQAHQFTAAWNLSAGHTTANLTDEFIEYNSSRYRDFLSSGGVACGSSATSVCYMDTTSNIIYMEIPHFSGLSPSIAGSAPAAEEAAPGGGGGYLGVTYNLGDLTTAGITKTLLESDKIKFKSENVSYNGTVNNVTSTSVNLTIAGSTFTLSVNETKKIDLDNDDVYEMSVKLEKIVAGAAYVNFKAITGAVIPPGEEGVEELCGNDVIDAGENCENCPADVKCADDEECKAGECVKKEAPKARLTWLWITLAVVAVVIGVVVYLATKKKKE